MASESDPSRRARGRGQRGADARRSQRQRSVQRPSERARRGDPARRAAWDLLRAVADGAYANLEMPRVLSRHRLAGRDAAFATEVAYGALRWRGLYLPVLEVAAGRPAAEIEDAVLDTLLLGVHQLLGMRVPGHAAVGETVALAREVNGAGAASFVNAVLRRVSERSRQEWVTDVTTGLGGTERLAVEHSHPEWIVRALRAALAVELAAGTDKEADVDAGVDADVDAELVALLEAHNTPAKVALVARPAWSSVDELLDAGARPGLIAPTAALLDHGAPADITAVRQGRAAVQDEGSQLLTLALVGARLDGPDAEWLDLCAGPGGKAGLLAALAEGRQVNLRANEVVPHRAELVARSLGVHPEHGETFVPEREHVWVTTGDGRLLGGDEPGFYDRVLVDAPCTGLGALRRRPEARWVRQPSDLPALGLLQRELLGSAVRATRPGGVIAYATCSPHLAETRLVLDDILAEHAELELLDTAAELRRAAAGGSPLQIADRPGGGAQLWTHRHGTDSMFVALLRRAPAASRPDRPNDE